MSKQSGTAGTPSGSDNDEEPKGLGVEDIPGAVSPSAAGASGSTGVGGGQAGLNERLAAFRERRAAQGGGGAPGGGAGANPARRGGLGRGQGQGQGMGMGRGRGGQGPRGQGGQGGGGRPNADDDPISVGKRVLEQFNARLAEAGEDKRPMQNAMRSVTRGYEALEKEVERLRHELERAHEAIRTVQRQGD